MRAFIIQARFLVSIMVSIGVCISSTFSVLQLFLYFELPTVLPLKLYFDLNLTSNFYFETLLRPVLLDQSEIQSWQKFEVQTTK